MRIIFILMKKLSTFKAAGFNLFTFTLTIPVALFLICITVNAQTWNVLGLLTTAQQTAGLTGGEANQWIKVIEYAPSDSTIVYAGNDVSGIWKSTDGGTTWVRKSKGITAKGIKGIAISPNDPNIVCVATHWYNPPNGNRPTSTTGIFRTTDGGDNWYLVKDINTGFSHNRKAGDIISWAGTSTTVYSGSIAGGLLKSADSGLTWFNIRDPGTDTFSGRSVVDVKVSPTNTDVVYACIVDSGTTSTGLHKITTNGSITVSSRSYLSASKSGTSYAVKSFPYGTATIYCALRDGNNRGIYRSTNDGTSFTAINSGISELTSWELDYFEVASTNQDKAAFTQASGANSRYGNASYWYCTNLGSSTPAWSNPSLADTQSGGEWISGSIVSENEGVFEGGRPTAFSPGDPSTRLSCIQYDVISKSTNDGSTWSYSNSGYQGVTRGVASVLNDNTAFAWDTTDANRYLVCGADYGARITTNGTTFRPLHDFYSAVSGRKSVLCGAIQPGGNVVILAVGDRGTQNLQRSTNTGSTTPVFTTVNPAIKTYDCIYFNGSDTTIIYAGNQKSTDSGVTWATVTSSYSISAVHPTNGNIVYYARYRSGATATIYRATNGGSSTISWATPFANVTTAPSSGTWGQFTVDPNDIDRCYLGMRGSGITIIDTGSTTVVTSGLGTSSVGNLDFVNICVDPFDSNTLYASCNSDYSGVQGTGTYRSTNKGITWTNYNGNISAMNSNAISVHPMNRRVYINSYAGSYYLNDTLVVGTPTATTGTATSVTSTSATLGGTVDPNNATTTCRWQYNTGRDSWGTSTATGSQTVGSGDAGVAMTQNITGLSASTAYFTRIQANNSSGSVSGSQTTFTTSAAYVPVIGTSTVYITEDTHVREDSATTIYGTTTTMLGRNGSNGFSWQMYVEADIGNPGSVTAVTLNMYCWQWDSNSTTWALYKVNAGSWTANTMNWNNKAGTQSATFANFVGTDTTARWRTIDITNYAQTLGSSTISLCIAANTAANGTRIAAGTSEGTTTPYFLVSYEGATDATAPTGTVSINSGATYTTSITGTVTLTATDDVGVEGYYLSGSTTTPYATQTGWVTVGTVTPYSADVGYALTSVDGTKTVYVWYKDGVDRISGSASDSIVLDTTAGIISITSPTTTYKDSSLREAFGTTGSTVTITGSSTDTNGIGTVTVSNTATSTTATATGTNTWNYTARILPVMDDGLVFYAKLDELTGTQRKDFSSYASHGTATGSVGTTTSKFGNAVYYDGVDDVDSFGDPADGHLDFGTGSFSYSLWVNIGTYTSNYDRAIYKGGSSASIPGYQMELGNSSWIAYISNGSVSSNVSFSATPFYNQWKLLTVVADRAGANLRAFVDDAQVGTASLSSWGAGSSTSSTSPLRLGSDGTNYWTNGYIDECRIYNRALSNAEVLQLYQLTTPDQSNVYSFTTQDNAGNQGTATINLGAFPAVQTDYATSITYNSATLNGTCSANNNTATVWYDYGLTSGYYTGSSTVGTVTGSADTAVNTSLGALTSNSSIYYRLVGSSSVAIIYGEEFNFDTLPNTRVQTNSQFNDEDMKYPGSTRFNVFLKANSIYPGLFWARNAGTKDGIDLRADPDTILTNFRDNN